mgnify:CR=1 FL=1
MGQFYNLRYWINEKKRQEALGNLHRVAVCNQRLARLDEYYKYLLIKSRLGLDRMHAIDAGDFQVVKECDAKLKELEPFFNKFFDECKYNM